MNMIYGVKDKPKFSQTLIFAIQQLLAIMAATLVVPVITNAATGSTLSPAAALFGAGIGTLVYLLFTKFRSPVFLGSSFAFLGSMAAAFAGGVSMSLGYVGLILGAVFAGLVYVVIALIVKFSGVGWLQKLMPVVVIGPTVAIIGLSLAGNAVSDLVSGSVTDASGAALASPLVTILCGLVALFVTMLCSTYGKKMVRLIPFILGILAGYAVAAIFTAIGNAAGIDALKVLDFSKLSVLWENGVTLKTFVNYELITKDFVFLKAIDGLKEVQEAVMLIEAGLSTYEKECAKRGDDYQEIFAQQVRETMERRTAGLKPPAWAAAAFESGLRQSTEEEKSDSRAA